MSPDWAAPLVDITNYFIQLYLYDLMYCKDGWIGCMAIQLAELSWIHGWKHTQESGRKKNSRTLVQDEFGQFDAEDNFLLIV